VKSDKAGKRSTERLSVDRLEGRVALVTQVDILNISLGGIAVKVDRRLNLGSECTLKLSQGKQLVCLRARVVWSALTGFRKKGRQQGPEYSVGMRFVDVINPKGSALVEFIKQNKGFKEQRLSGLRVPLATRGRAVLDQPHPFRVKLISSRSMVIEIGKELDLNQSYPMEVMVDELRVISMTGRVSSRLEMAPKRYEIGVDFARLSARDKALLKSLLQKV
jgi:hypothetical protein